MAAQDNENAPAPLTAPYTAFPSVRTAVRNMKEHGVPSRIDRSVLTNFSGSVASQVMQAFKFLKLTTDAGAPTQALFDLVASGEKEGEWASALAPIIKSAYSPMFTLDLFTASPAQFHQHFRKNYPSADNVSRKSLTFFVTALQEAKIPVSPYILKNKKPRSSAGGSPKKRVAKAAGKAKGEAFVAGTGANLTPPQVTPKAPSEILLDLFDASMGQNEQTAVWTLIKYFKGVGK